MLYFGINLPTFPRRVTSIRRYLCSPTFFARTVRGLRGLSQISGFSAILGRLSKDRFRSLNIRSPPRYRNILRLKDEIVLKYPFHISSRIIYLFFTVEWGVIDSAYLSRVRGKDNFILR